MTMIKIRKGLAIELKQKAITKHETYDEIITRLLL